MPTLRRRSAEVPAARRDGGASWAEVWSRESGRRAQPMGNNTAFESAIGWRSGYANAKRQSLSAMSTCVSPVSVWRFGVLGFDSLHPLQLAHHKSHTAIIHRTTDRRRIRDAERCCREAATPPIQRSRRPRLDNCIELPGLENSRRNIGASFALNPTLTRRDFRKLTASCRKNR